jgi:hypothetical protein
MSGQLQLRRGSTAENDAFTGVVGELTYDTVKKELRIHDGTTQGGIKIPTEQTADYVVDFQVPTAENNYTWYRKYKSGWIEQGGQLGITSAAGGTVTLPIQMSNIYYNVFVQTAFNGDQAVVYRNRTTTSFDYSGNVGKDSWYVCGMAA